MSEHNPINIIITDDSTAFIEALKSLLSINPDYNVLDVCNNGLDLVNNSNIPKANLLLVDIEMPKMNGLDAAKKINFQYPNLPMIALTMHQEKFFLADIVRSGFRAFIYKPEIPQKLFGVIEMVLLNKFVFPDNLKIDK